MASLVSNLLSHSSFVDLIDVTLACEDTNSKLVDVVTFPDVDIEESVDDRLVIKR